MRRALACAVAAVAFAGVASAGSDSTATLRVELRVDYSKGVYIEGAYYYVVLRRGTTRVARRFPGTRVTLRVSPGRYVMRSYARPCDGNCGFLDPPTAGCVSRLQLRAGTTRVRILAQPGSPCRIRRLA